MRPVVRSRSGIVAAALAVTILSACSAPATSPTGSPGADASAGLDAIASPSASFFIPEPTAHPTATPGVTPYSPPPPTPKPTPEHDPSELSLMASTTGWEVRCTSDWSRCQISHQTPDPEDAWPVTVDGPCPAIEMDYAIRGFVVACDPPGGAVIHAFDQDGSTIPGWPRALGVELASVNWNDRSLGCGPDTSPLLVAPDDAIVVATNPGPVAEVVVLEPDGSVRRGWPQPFPGDRPGPDGWGGDGCRGLAIAPDASSIVAWGYQGVVDQSMELEADRTEFVAWDLAGRVRLGWPFGSRGAASGPALRADGGIAYTSRSGKVWAHDPSGAVRDGWPYEIPDLGADDVVGAPITSRSGQLVVLESGFVVDGRDHRLHVIGPDGRGVARLQIRPLVETRCLFGDTPCGGEVAAAIHPRTDVAYVALGARHDVSAADDPGGSILAIGADGTVVDGWPVALGPRVHALHLQLSLDGQLLVDAVRCVPTGCGEGPNETVSIAIEPDGSILD